MQSDVLREKLEELTRKYARESRGGPPTVQSRREYRPTVPFTVEPLHSRSLPVDISIGRISVGYSSDPQFIASYEQESRRLAGGNGLREFLHNDQERKYTACIRHELAHAHQFAMPYATHTAITQSFDTTQEVAHAFSRFKSVLLENPQTRRTNQLASQQFGVPYENNHVLHELFAYASMRVDPFYPNAREMESANQVIEVLRRAREMGYSTSALTYFEQLQRLLDKDTRLVAQAMRQVLG